jgi:uroporphyrinogen decarboxylase
MKKFLDTLNGKIFETPPIWLMRQAGRYLPEYLETRAKAGSFLDLCYNPQLATEVTLQPIRRYGFDASILFSDILVVPHALGQELSFAENHGPVLGDCPNPLTFKESAFHVNLSPVYETVSLIKENLQKEGFAKTTLIGFSGAPWTLACYMIDRKGSKDFAQTRIMALTQPEKFSALIDILVEAISVYLIKQIEHGADAIQIFDSWAGVLPADQFRKWVIEPTTRIIKTIKSRYPAIPIIGFPKGAGLLYPDYAKTTSVTAIGIDTQMPVEWVRDTLQPLLPVQGNLDPFTLVAGGQALDKAIDDILSTWNGKPYVFNLGHGIDKSTPPAHVQQLVDRVRGKYR